jgi:periodic tryptophan protein 2
MVCFWPSRVGQLIVWEWQLETFILRRQGHSYDTTYLDYSPDGYNIVSDGNDGKVKVWNS